jgi:hypothetical protein
LVTFGLLVIANLISIYPVHPCCHLGRPPK